MSDSYEMEQLSDPENDEYSVENTAQRIERALEGATGRYHIASISAATVSAVNKHRESFGMKQFTDDNDIMNIAMEHSLCMARGERPFTTDAVSERLSQYSFVAFEAHVTRHPANHSSAFTTVVSQWTTQRNISASILGAYNCAGAGFAISNTNEGFFTLILALRSVIGSSYFTGTALKSMLLADRCTDLLNTVRAKSKIREVKLDWKLCDYAYGVVGVPVEEMTIEVIQDKIGKHSDICIAFGSIKKVDERPELIVEEWLNQMGKNRTYLGDFNRIGIGLKENAGMLQSVIIMIRDLRAAIMDGTEQLRENGAIADDIVEKLNTFRDQHKLDPLLVNDKLAEIAQEHAMYVANGQNGMDPVDDDENSQALDDLFTDTDITYYTCREMERAPQSVMRKWRSDRTCLSVILDDASDIGVGVCYDDDYACHITIIVGSTDSGNVVINRIVHF